MKITQVSVTPDYRYIPLHGMDQLRAALDLYAHRPSELEGSIDRFVTTMLAEVQERLKTRDHWFRPYDSFMIGTPFAGTHVHFEVLDREQEIYGLSIRVPGAAGESREYPERALAESLHIERALEQIFIEVTTDPEPDHRFSFDFRRLLACLTTAIPIVTMTGEDLAKAVAVFLLPKDRDRDYFQFAGDHSVSLGLGMGAIDYGFDAPGQSWSVSGSILSGHLRQAEADPARYDAPSFFLMIIHRDSGLVLKKPMWEPACKAHALALAGHIAGALRAG